MPKIVLFRDMERFLNLIVRSKGDVFLRLPDDTLCNLKENSIAMQLLKVLTPGRDGLNITLSDQADFPAFLQYMMEVAYDGSACTQSKQ